MRRIAPFVAAAAAAAVAGAAFVAGGSAQAPSGERTFTLIERDVTFGLVDNPPRNANPRSQRRSAGDSLVLSSAVFNDRNVRVGAFFASCTVIQGAPNLVRATLQCQGTYKLSGGTLAVTAAFRGTSGLTGAIAGGTGIYEGARGSTTTRDRPGGRTETRVHLLP